MHSITLNVKDIFYKPVISFLKHWDNENITIVEDKKIENSTRKNRIKKLLEENNNLFKDIKNPLEWQKEQRG